VRLILHLSARLVTQVTACQHDLRQSGLGNYKIGYRTDPQNEEVGSSEMLVNTVKTCLKRNLEGSKTCSAEAKFPFNQGYTMTVTGPENISV
jgi:hypothetical protein